MSSNLSNRLKKVRERNARFKPVPPKREKRSVSRLKRAFDTAENAIILKNVAQGNFLRVLAAINFKILSNIFTRSSSIPKFKKESQLSRRRRRSNSKSRHTR